MAVRDCLDHFLAEKFSEFHDPLLVAKYAEVPSKKIPNDTHGRSLPITHEQSHYAGYRNQESDKSPFSHKIGKSHIAFHWE